MNGLVTTFAVLLVAFVVCVTLPFFVAVERPAQGGEERVAVPESAVLEGVAATADLVDGDAGPAPATADRGLVGRVDGAAVDKPVAGGAGLRERGWVEVAADGVDRYVGWYRVEGVMRPGVVERTASGRLKVYVQAPTARLRLRAHYGLCLRQPGAADLDGGDGWREVNFAQGPDRVVDAVRHVESMLEGS